MFLGGAGWGIVFENFISAPQRGFYILPALMMAMVYAWYPFRLAAANIFTSALCGTVLFIGTGLMLTKGAVPSTAFFLHGAVFVALSELILYGIEKNTYRQYRY